MSAGYGIGVSGSRAESTSQGTQAATVFNFSSPGTSFDGGTQTLSTPSTAVATTKSPGAENNVDNPGLNVNARNPSVSGNLFPALQNNPEIVTYGLIAVVVIGAAFLLYRNLGK